MNGVAVNAEVVRSRAKDLKKSDDLVPFAERAILQVGVANALTEGLLALFGCVLTAQADGTLRLLPGHGARTEMELMIDGARAESLVFAIKRFAHMIGVGVEQHGERVILSLSPEGRSHSKE
ncbi:MAG: hypothetical protein ACREMS_01050 [Gemmatimonadaceae bacterium]